MKIDKEIILPLILETVFNRVTPCYAELKSSYVANRSNNLRRNANE